MNIGVEVLKESVIRVQSQLNDWMDCVFVVSKDDEEKARSDSTPAMQTQSCVMRSSSTHYSEQWFLVKEARLWQH